MNLSCVVYFAVQGGSNFLVWMKSCDATIQMNPLQQYWLMTNKINDIPYDSKMMPKCSRPSKY